MKKLEKGSFDLNNKFFEDEELLKHLRRSDQPEFDKIVLFAKKFQIKTPSDFWEFHDKAIAYWKNFKSTEGDFLY